jgi:hypothetical protein
MIILQFYVVAVGSPLQDHRAFSFSIIAFQALLFSTPAPPQAKYYRPKDRHDVEGGFFEQISDSTPTMRKDSSQPGNKKALTSWPQAISILPQTGAGLILMAKNKKKSKGSQNRNKNSQNDQVNAAPKKEKKPEASKPVEAKVEKAAPAPKVEKPKAQAKAEKKAPEAPKEKSFFSGIVDSVKKLVKA